MHRGQTVYCATELYLSVDKRKKTTDKEGTMLVCNVYVMCILCHVLKTGNTYTPAQLQTLVKKLSVVIITQLLSFDPFAISTFVPSAITKYLVKSSDV